jgi:hypothetical protein
MPWVALPDSLHLCKISGCLYTLHVQDLHIFMALLANSFGHRNFSYDIISDFFMRCTFQDPTGYPRVLGIVELRPLRGGQAYKSSLMLALPE